MLIKAEKAIVETIEFRATVSDVARGKLEMLAVEEMDSCRYDMSTGEVVVRVESILYK